MPMHHGATLAGYFHFSLRSTISVHKFPSTTTPIVISPLRYSFMCMNELKIITDSTYATVFCIKKFFSSFELEVSLFPSLSKQTKKYCTLQITVRLDKTTVRKNVVDRYMCGLGYNSWGWVQ